MKNKNYQNSKITKDLRKLDGALKVQIVHPGICKN